MRNNKYCSKTLESIGVTIFLCGAPESLGRGEFVNTSDELQEKSKAILASSKNNIFSLNKRIVFRREKILEKDREKRRNIMFSFAFLLIIALVSVLFLAFKPSVLQDNQLINNVELLTNNEGLDFYNDIEFYQWLDSSTLEKPVGSIN